MPPHGIRYSGGTFEDILDSLRVTHRRDEHDEVQLRIFPDQLLLDLISVVLIDIDNDQLFRLMTGDLPAQLTSDGPATAGDQYDLILHIVQDFFRIDLYRISA